MLRVCELFGEPAVAVRLTIWYIVFISAIRIMFVNILLGVCMLVGRMV